MGSRTMISQDKEPSGKPIEEGRPFGERPLGKLIGLILIFIIGFIGAPVLIITILSAVRKEQEKADRMQSGSNLKQIWKAMKSYHDSHGHLPPTAAYGKDGQPLYSWRVLLLPFLGEEDLYSQFRLDEPWDSPNNKPLLAKMPLVYVHPTEGKPKEPYGTYYQVFVGGGAVFEAGPDNKPLTLRQIDAAQAGLGTANTLLVIEAANPVPWTKPEDLIYNSDEPLPKLGRFYPEHGYVYLMADGSVHGTYLGQPEDSIRAVIPWKGFKPPEGNK